MLFMTNLERSACILLGASLGLPMAACKNEGGGGASSIDGSTGAGGSTSFVAATPPADVCALLTLTDVQTILPTATAGTVEAPADPTPDVWTRICTWNAAAGLASVDLVLFGAVNAQGLQAVTIIATTGPGNGTKTPVAGLGDRAIYWEDADVSTRGLTALKGTYSVDVTA